MYILVSNTDIYIYIIHKFYWQYRESYIIAYVIVYVYIHVMQINYTKYIKVRNYTTVSACVSDSYVSMLCPLLSR